jgi:hypothetical protein
MSGKSRKLISKFRGDISSKSEIIRQIDDSPAKYSEKMSSSIDAPMCAIPLARGG